MLNQHPFKIRLALHCLSYQIIQFNQRFKNRYGFILQLTLQQMSKKMN